MKLALYSNFKIVDAGNENITMKVDTKCDVTHCCRIDVSFHMIVNIMLWMPLPMSLMSIPRPKRPL